jgi:hypothetical protein
MGFGDQKRLLKGFPSAPSPLTQANIAKWVRECTTYLDSPFVDQLSPRETNKHLLGNFVDCAWYADMKKLRPQQEREVINSPVISLLQFIQDIYTSPTALKTFDKKLLLWTFDRNLKNVTTGLLQMRKLLKQGSLVDWIPTVRDVRDALRDGFRTHPLAEAFRLQEMVLTPYTTSSADDFLNHWSTCSGNGGRGTHTVAILYPRRRADAPAPRGRQRELPTRQRGGRRG